MLKKMRGRVTVQSCAMLCKGYRYFGVEYSSECVYPYRLYRGITWTVADG